MGPEQPALTPEAVDSPKEQKNSFPMSIDKPAQDLMATWGMTIDKDTIMISGVPGKNDYGDGKLLPMKFVGIKELAVSAVGTQLKITEKDDAGLENIYLGQSPQEVMDAMVYVGILYMQKHSDQIPSLDYAKKMSVRKTTLEALHPDYVTFYKDTYK